MIVLIKPTFFLCVLPVRVLLVRLLPVRVLPVRLLPVRVLQVRVLLVRVLLVRVLLVQSSPVQSSPRNTVCRKFFIICKLRSGFIFVSLWKWHSSGQGETKREPDTNLLRSVCHPLFWLIDICRISQPKLLPLFVFFVCKFLIRGKHADSLAWKIA